MPRWTRMLGACFGEEERAGVEHAVRQVQGAMRTAVGSSGLHVARGVSHASHDGQSGHQQAAVADDPCTDAALEAHSRSAMPGAKIGLSPAAAPSPPDRSPTAHQHPRPVGPPFSVASPPSPFHPSPRHIVRTASAFTPGADAAAAGLSCSYPPPPRLLLRKSASVSHTPDVPLRGVSSPLARFLLLASEYERTRDGSAPSLLPPAQHPRQQGGRLGAGLSARLLTGGAAIAAARRFRRVSSDCSGAHSVQLGRSPARDAAASDAGISLMGLVPHPKPSAAAAAAAAGGYVPQKRRFIVHSGSVGRAPAPTAAKPTAAIPAPSPDVQLAWPEGALASPTKGPTIRAAWEHPTDTMSAPLSGSHSLARIKQMLAAGHANSSGGCSGGAAAAAAATTSATLALMRSASTGLPPPKLRYASRRASLGPVPGSRPAGYLRRVSAAEAPAEAHAVHAAHASRAQLSRTVSVRLSLSLSLSRSLTILESIPDEESGAESSASERGGRQEQAEEEAGGQGLFALLSSAEDDISLSGGEQSQPRQQQQSDPGPGQLAMERHDSLEAWLSDGPHAVPAAAVTSNSPPGVAALGTSTGGGDSGAGQREREPSLLFRLSDVGPSWQTPSALAPALATTERTSPTDSPHRQHAGAAASGQGRLTLTALSVS